MSGEKLKHTPKVADPSIEKTMHFREEILRGIRMALIVFALGLLAVVIHRMVRIDFAAVPAAAQPAETKPAGPPIIGGSSPGSIPPPPPGQPKPITLVRK